VKPDVRVETMPPPSPIEAIVGLPVEAKVGAVVALVLFAGLGVLKVARRPGAPRMCRAACTRCLQAQPCALSVRKRIVQQPKLHRLILRDIGFGAHLERNASAVEQPPASTRPMETLSLQHKQCSCLPGHGSRYIVGKEFALPFNRYIYCRAATNDIVVDDAAAGAAASQDQIRGQRSVPLRSSHHQPTSVNGKPMRGRRKLKEDDRIQIGNTSLCSSKSGSLSITKARHG